MNKYEVYYTYGTGLNREIVQADSVEYTSDHKIMLFLLNGNAVYQFSVYNILYMKHL